MDEAITISETLRAIPRRMAREALSLCVAIVLSAAACTLTRLLNISTSAFSWLDIVTIGVAYSVSTYAIEHRGLELLRKTFPALRSGALRIPTGRGARFGFYPEV